MKETRWISVKVAMPADDVQVLAMFGKWVFQGYRSNGAWWNKKIPEKPYEPESPITHWLPLPAPLDHLLPLPED